MTSVSKGKGFAGVMKRHGFSGLGAATAPTASPGPGRHRRLRHPSRVFRGTRMAGRTGGQKTTTLNLTVVQADGERDLLLVKGSVPGPKGGIVLVATWLAKAAKGK